MIGPMMALLAETVGDDDRAGHWALWAIDDARSRGSLAGVAALGWQVAAHISGNNRFVEALDAGREAAIATVAQRLLYDQGRVAPVFDADPMRILEVAASDVQRRQVDKMVIDWVGTSVAFGLGRLALDNRDAAKEQAANVIEFCRSTATEVASPQLWNGFASVLSATYVDEVAYQELNRRANEAAQGGDNVLHLVGYLGMSFQADTPLEVAAIVHAMIMPLAERLLSGKSTFYRVAVLPFVRQYWETAIDGQPFRFTSPRIVKEALEAARRGPEQQRAKTLMKAVISGLSIRLPDDADDTKRWLNG